MIKICSIIDAIYRSIVIIYLHRLLLKLQTKCYRNFDYMLLQIRTTHKRGGNLT
jgi:hypothetical protein